MPTHDVKCFRDDSVSIIIPAFNNRQLLQKNLPLLLDVLQERGGRDEIIVVDDASSDDTQAFLEEHYPAIVFCRNVTNLGFVGACNAGIARASKPYILLLNSDVAVTPGFLDPLLRHFTRSDLFGVSPLIVRPLPELMIQSFSRFEFCAGYFMLCWGQSQDTRRCVPVLFPSGACALYDASKLREIGELDELYKPFYWEDVDLGYMAWKRGWASVCEPSSVVYHEESVTITHSKHGRRKEVMGERNRFLFIWKNISDIDYILLHALITLPRCLVRALCYRDPSLLKGLLAALPLLPKALRARRKVQRYRVRTDKEVVKCLMALRVPDAAKA